MTNFDYPDIAIILYDDLPGFCDDIRQNLIDFTEFKLNGRYQLDMRITRDIDQTINEVSDQGYKWSGVITVGNFLQDQMLIIDTINHAINENSPLACHILDKGGYYHFHQQWFALDLKKWSQVGRPRLSEYSGAVDIKTNETERSPDNVHDGYTPWWLRPESEEKKCYHSDHGYFGLHTVAAFIDAGYNITNIPQIIRNRKNYCYPHHNHDRLIRIIKGETFEIDDVALQYFKQCLDQLVNGLHLGYYVLNTENFNNHPEFSKRLYDCFIGVCGGIKPVCISGRDNFVSNSKIILFDISQAALQYQEFLLNNWDGDFSNFETVWKEFQSMHANYRPHYFSNHSIQDNISWFLDSAGLTREEFHQRWARYKNMSHEFVHLDLLDENSVTRLKKLMEGSTGSYVWLSNSFNMDYLMFYKTKAWCDSYNRKFVQALTENRDCSVTIENCGSVNFYD